MDIGINFLSGEVVLIPTLLNDLVVNTTCDFHSTGR